MANNKLVKCPYCEGHGEINSPWTLEGPDFEGCPYCDGTGKVTEAKAGKIKYEMSHEVE